MNGLFDNLLMAYFGTKTFDPYKEPFYVECLDYGFSDCIVEFKKRDAGAPTVYVEYSPDKVNWTALEGTSTTGVRVSFSVGRKMYFRCRANTWGGTAYYQNNINIYNRYVRLGGNIMSLIYGSNFTGSETTFPANSTYNFHQLFYGNTNIKYADTLLLPATTLTEGCYGGMFAGNYQLVSIPTLPATRLDENCYSSMFSGCTSLNYAPELPATTLTWSCYYGMFENCTSLVQAPELPARTIGTQSYMFMFKGCTSLRYIKCLATNLGQGGTTHWVTDVPSGGTFVKNGAMTSWTTGENGIPDGWTVQNA